MKAFARISLLVWLLLSAGTVLGANGDPLIEGKAGSGAALTDLNASNISSGTLSNSRYNALSDLGGGSGTTYLKKDGSWGTPVSGGSALEWFVADHATYGYTDEAIQAAVNAAQAAGGGVVYIPAGNWTINSTITVTGAYKEGVYGRIYLKGAGPRVTVITRSTNFGDSIKFQPSAVTWLYNCGVSDMSIQYYNTGTDMTSSHALLSLYYVVNSTFDNLVLSNGGIGVAVYGRCNASLMNNLEITTDPYHVGNTGLGFYEGSWGAGGSNYGNTFIVSNSDIYPSNLDGWTYAVYIASSDGIWMNNVHMGRGKLAACFISPQDSEAQLSGLKFDNCWFDYDIAGSDVQDYGVYIAGTTSKPFGLFNFSNCMFQGGTNAYYGFVIASGCGVHNVNVNDSIFFGYQRNAISLAGGSKIAISDNLLSQNSTVGAGSYDGIYVSTSYFTISGNNIGYLYSSSGDSSIRYGIYVGGTANHFSIINNNLRGNNSNTGIYQEGTVGSDKTIVSNPDDTTP